MKWRKAGAVVLLLFFYQTGFSQPGEKRIQYPKSLKNSFFGINIGWLHYPYSAAQLEPGFTVESIKSPGLGPPIVLYGFCRIQRKM